MCYEKSIHQRARKLLRNHLTQHPHLIDDKEIPRKSTYQSHLSFLGLCQPKAIFPYIHSRDCLCHVPSHVPLFSHSPLTSKGQAENQEEKNAKIKISSRKKKKPTHNFVLIFPNLGFLMRNSHSCRKDANKHLQRIQVNIVNILKPWLTWLPAL